MKIGISSYTFPWAVGVPGFGRPERSMTAIDLLGEARRLGAAVLQFGDNLPLHELAEADIDLLGNIADRDGIAIEVGTRGISAATLQTYLDLAKRLNARLVRTLIPRTPSNADVDCAVNELAAMLPAFETAGVVLALENYELYSAAEFAEILQRLPSPYLSMCLDTANNLGCAESVDDMVRAVGQRIACLHVKDIRISRIASTMGFKVEGCPAGEGVIDLPHVLEALVAASVTMPRLSIILEQWPPAQSDLRATIALEREWANSSFCNVIRLMQDMSGTAASLL